MVVAASLMSYERASDAIVYKYSDEKKPSSWLGGTASWGMGERVDVFLRLCQRDFAVGMVCSR